MEIEVRGFKYGKFGLRKEWLYQLLANGEDFFFHNTLGPRQFEAFLYFLKDCQLIDKKKNFIELFDILKQIFKEEGIDSKILWGIVWINLCFSSPLFRWWANIPEGFYTREDIINLLADSYGKRNTTIVSGYSSILETLERSPVGIYFGQGIVKREGRVRTVLKENNISDVPPLLPIYNLYKLSKETGEYRFNIKDIEDITLSPQKILSLSSKKVESILGMSQVIDFFDIDFGERKNYIVLKNKLEPIDILKQYWGGKLSEV